MTDEQATEAAVAAERARIAGLLHAEAAQALSAALLHLDLVARRSRRHASGGAARGA